MSKNIRVLEIYSHLCEGRIINKAEEAEKYHVDERSIERDICDIREFLSDEAVNGGKGNLSVEYDRAKKGYVLSGEESSLMTNAEILAVSKILLASRAFTKREISGILDKLVSGCVPFDNMKLVKDLIRNEKFHYVELRHKSVIKDKLWELGVSIEKSEIVRISYERQVKSNDTVSRNIIPVAVLFSEYYFYLNAFILDKDEKGAYSKKYDYPAIFRIDRIKNFKPVGEKYIIQYSDRFEEGEFRKRIQFMFAGDLMRVRFRIKDRALEAALDRLPTAVIIENEGGSHIVEAEVYGKGILMWLLSQATNIEVLSPELLRLEIKGTMREMLSLYE